MVICYLLLIRKNVQQQFLDIYSYYEDLKVGLGDRFEEEMERF